MLVLSRKPGESIRIGSAVLTVLSVQGNRVEIGIEAPRDVRVLRHELEQAAESQPQLNRKRELLPA